MMKKIIVELSQKEKEKLLRALESEKLGKFERLKKPQMIDWELKGKENEKSRNKTKQRGK